MRLIDFNRSTIDLSPGLSLFWEVDHAQQPITDLRPADHQLLLVAGTGHPLTLDQFWARCQLTDPHANLFIATEPPTRLYGYRLVPHQILLG